MHQLCPDTLLRLSLKIRQLKVANAKEYRFRVMTEEGAWNEPRDRARAERITAEQRELIEQDKYEIKQLIKELGL